MMKRMKTFGTSLILVMGLLAGCGGGGGSGTNSETTNSGQFYDSPVANVEYSTSTGLSGRTDGNGTFRYRTGDTVTFKVGKVVLGSAEAGEFITPVDLVGNNTDNVLIISAFLLALDSDGNPDNGIQVKSDNITVSKEIHLWNCALDELPEEIKTKVEEHLEEAKEHLSGSIFDLLNATLQKLDNKEIEFHGPNMSGSCYFELNSVNDTEKTITAEFVSCEGDMEDDNVTFSVENGTPYLYEGDGKRDIVLHISHHGFCFYTDDVGKICVRSEDEGASATSGSGGTGGEGGSGTSGSRE